jgi:opacity protein-like surface antigen
MLGDDGSLTAKGDRPGGRRARLVRPSYAGESKIQHLGNGYTLGGGAEYALRNGFSFGVDYAYVDLDTDRFTVRCATCPSGVGGGVPVVDGGIEIQSVTARMNYRFGN